MNKYAFKKLGIYSIAIMVLALSFYKFIIPLGFFEKKINQFGNLTWKFEAQSEIVDAPLFDGNNIYIQSKNHIYALDPSTGMLIWKTPILRSSGASRDNFLKVKDDTLVVLRNESSALALSTESGDILWQNQGMANRVLDASIFEDTVYVARQSSLLEAINLHSGEMNWSSNVPDRTSLYVFLESEVVYLGTSTNLQAFNAYDGQLMWEHDLNGLAGEMLAENNILYLAFINGECSFATFDIKSLEYLWCIPPQDVALSDINNMLVEKGVFYISGNKVVAIEANTGSLIWQSEIQDNFGVLITYQDQVYVQGQTKIYEMSLSTGESQIVFSYPNMYITKWMVYSSIEPVIVEDKILISIGKNLYSYNVP